MFWWMIGFEDLSRPAGKRYVGSVIVKHDGGFEAAAEFAVNRIGAEELLTCEAIGGMMEAKYGEPPAEYVGRLLGRAEAEQAAKLWGGGVATRKQVHDAMMKDDASDGEPIFEEGGEG